jgi:hypothetical protein
VRLECDSTTCLIYERVHAAREGRNPFVITEFEHSLFVVGDHQFHAGIRWCS